MTISSLESYLPFIVFANSNTIIDISEINLDKSLSLTKSIQLFFYQRKIILILDSKGIKSFKIHKKTETYILHLIKKNNYSYERFERPYKVVN